MEYQFDWDEKLNTGIPWIDSQHKKLLLSFNALLNVILTKSDYVQVSKVLKFMHDYVKAHFQTEEKFMLQHNYPAYNIQKKQHALFENKIETLRKEYERIGPTEEFVRKVANEIWLWYKEHIATCDKKFADHLKSRKLVNIDDEASDLFDELLKGF